MKTIAWKLLKGFLYIVCINIWYDKEYIISLLWFSISLLWMWISILTSVTSAHISIGTFEITFLQLAGYNFGPVVLTLNYPQKIALSARNVLPGGTCRYCCPLRIYKTVLILKCNVLLTCYIFITVLDRTVSQFYYLNDRSRWQAQKEDKKRGWREASPDSSSDENISDIMMEKKLARWQLGRTQGSWSHHKAAE